MVAQGLLVKGTGGEDFLLTTEPNLGLQSNRLVVRQQINGRWKQVDDHRTPGCREALIGAFVDFLVDLCRVLNASGPEPVSEVIRIQSPSVRHARAAHTPLRSRKRSR